VLERIAIHNFAVARDVTVELQPGVTVFTGETGAGKSLVVDALAFACGARRGREVIATGAERARVAISLNLGGHPQEIERSISRAGRSAARIDGVVATVDQLQDIGARLADIHGQSGHLAILRSSVQRDLLDAYAGLSPARERLASNVRELRDTRRAIASLTTDARERERRIDQLRFEFEEIDAAGLVPGEDETLRQEQSRLANSQSLIEASERIMAALDVSGVAEAVEAAGAITSRDESAEDLSELAATLEASAAELTREARRYRDSIEDDPARLVAINESLDLIARLRRKYGETIEAILAYAASAAEELAALERSGTSIEELEQREASLVPGIAAIAGELSHDRRNAARDLIAGVGEQLQLLGMPNARLAVGFETVEADPGIPLALPDYDRVDAEWEPLDTTETVALEVNETGADRIEFLASFNAGQEPRPLSAVASGGETSRFLLALAIVFGESASPRTVVLDEVDEGVGGRAGSLVGEALRRLGKRHQVLCITHLPQVAAYGDHHLVVRKHSDGKATWSSIAHVDGEDRIEELASMLGGVGDATKEAARDLLAAASGSRSGAGARSSAAPSTGRHKDGSRRSPRILAGRGPGTASHRPTSRSSRSTGGAPPGASATRAQG
jgi:DNA repair protein RecN (Recombination protein N)